MTLRSDEARAMREMLGLPLIDRMGLDWQHVADELEYLIALASWRSQSLEVRVAALVEALAAVHETPVYKRWGAIDP